MELELEPITLPGVEDKRPMVMPAPAVPKPKNK